jgi:hypothetical protein
MFFIKNLTGDNYGYAIFTCDEENRISEDTPIISGLTSAQAEVEIMRLTRLALGEGEKLDSTNR